MKYLNIIILFFFLAIVSTFVQINRDISYLSSNLDLSRKKSNADLNKIFYPSLKNLINYYDYLKFKDSTHNIPEIQIKISPQNILKIEKDRLQALEYGYLKNPKYVKAVVIGDNWTSKSKIRLKGELKDHWKDIVRASLLIRLEKVHPDLKLKDFSINKPSSRQFPSDFMFQKLKKKYKLINRNQYLIKVMMNGKDWGYMIAEEHWGKDFFLNHKINEGPIIKFGDELSINPKSIQKIHNNISKSLKIKNKYLGKKIINQDTALKFDISKFAYEIALTESFKSFHPITHANMRLYYDPIKEMIMPITSDQDHPLSFASLSRPVKMYKETMNTWGFWNYFYNKKFAQHLQRARSEISKSLKKNCIEVIDENIKVFRAIKNSLRVANEYCETISKNSKNLDSEKFFETHFENDKRQLIDNLKKNNEYYENLVWQGNVKIEKDIIINNLIVSPGTEITICAKCNVVLKGSIKFFGKKNNKIIITRNIDKNETSGKFHLYISNSDSQISYLNLTFNSLKKITGNTSGMLIMGDGLIKVKNLNIQNSPYEDAINIKNANIELDDVTIKNSISDGIDLDYVTGEINNLFIKNSNGDGLDLSGSNIKVSNLNIENSGDKGISIGERSEIKITDAHIKNSSVCIAIKDGSIFEYNDNVRFKNCEYYDFAIYNKKTYLENPKLILNFNDINKKINIITDNVKNIIFERNYSKFDNNVKIVPNSFFQKLYKEGFMKK